MATTERMGVRGRPVAGTGDEERWLAALRGDAGDRPAAEALVEATYRRTYRTLLRLCGGDAELAADLTQDTYRKAWSALGGFDGRSRFSTWLFRIAYTTFLNHARRPRVVLPFGAGDREEGGSNFDAIPDPAPAADHALADRASRDRLRRAVLALPDDLRFTVTARFWGDLPVREIARQEGITGVAVRKRLARAMRLLAVQLEEEQP